MALPADSAELSVGGRPQVNAPCMMTTRVLAAAFVLFSCTSLMSTLATAQLSKPIPPRSVALAQALSEVKAIEMPGIDRSAIDAEDRANNDDGQPLRVAYPFATQLDMKSGQWDELPDGGRLWRLRVSAPGAQAISLLYDRFYLPPGATMHVYNPTNGETIGAFTSANNRPSRKFATALTYGDQAVIEYYEPADQRGQGDLRVSQVGHAYRLIEVLEEAQRAAAVNSGACQVNVNCQPEGDNWQDHKRSVARILLNGSGLCTGALINNTAQDGTPLFLTADHCIGSLDALGNADASGYVFYWNYERANCANTSTPNASETTSGATLRANDSPGDFALFELTENPNSLYNVYFGGFSAATVPPVGGVGIHHPAGDYKKIATHSIAPVSFTFGSRPAGSYWNISWDATANGHSVTEGGSSGSPLFDANGFIIGQLYGGSSINCSDPANDPGWYGKIAYNWTNGGASQPERRLNAWLDPTSNGATTSVAGGYISPPPPTVNFATSDFTVSESSASGMAGCRGYVDVDIPIQLSGGQPTSPVTATLSTFGSADAFDAQIIQGSVSLGSGNPTAGNFTVRIWNDDAIESTEDLTLDLVVAGSNGAAGVNSTLVLTIEDNDTALGTGGAQQLINESFDSGLPPSWTVTNAGAASTAWNGVATRSNNSLNGTAFMIADSDAGGSSSTTNTTITTPSFDATGASSILLSFDEYFRVYTAGGTETGTLEVYNGAAWIQVLQHTEAGGSSGSWTSPNTQSIDLTAYASSNMQLRFSYQAAYDWWWAIDDIVLSAVLPNSTATTVTAPFQTYLSPNATVALRDPSTGQAIAEVANLTPTDHGCLTVETDRDATTQTTYAFHSNDPAEAAYAKTLRLTPQLSATAGEYDLRWFFTPTEVAAWETATGKSFASLGGIAKVSGPVAFGDVTPANFSTYTVDWQPATIGTAGPLQYLESSFVTGFSAFGMVSDPAAAPLPVELTELQGRHIAGQGNLLEWTTATERNNDRFVIESSRDGRAFRQNGTKTAGLTPDREQHYSYLDHKAQEGTTYYRLKQVDLDGSSDLSEVIAISASKTGQVKLTANLQAQALRLNTDSGLSTLTLRDALGRTVDQWLDVEAGRHVLTLDGRLASGAYVLEARSTRGAVQTVTLSLP